MRTQALCLFVVLMITAACAANRDGEAEARMTREAPAAAPAPSLSAADVGSDLRQEHVVFELHAPNAEGPHGEVRLVPKSA